MGLDAENRLIEQALDGDQAALGELLMRYQHRLFNTVLRMVGNRDDAEEVTQDVFVKVIKNLDGFDRRSALMTWMTRIAMNLSISHLRKQKLRRTVSLDATLPGNGSGNAGATSGGGRELQPLRDRLEGGGELPPDQCVEQSEMATHLQDAIDRLDDDFRAVLVLRDINEMDYQQIAEALDVPVGTVKSRLFRARVALRQEMTTVYPSIAMERSSASATSGAASGGGDA